MFSGSSAVAAGRLYSTQWTHVPAGASGSSAISAKLTVPAGAPLQASGGETSAPSHVYLTGTADPSVKAVLVSENSMAVDTRMGDSWFTQKAKPGAGTAPRVDRSGEVGRRHFGRDLSDAGQASAARTHAGGGTVLGVSENGQTAGAACGDGLSLNLPEIGCISR